MAKHHYVPVTYLAGFSIESLEKPARNRKVWVGDKVEGKIFHTSVNNICAIHDYYKLVTYEYSGGKDPNIFEKNWGDYECRLAKAIEDLITGNLTAREWIRILVPFITSMFIRTETFESRSIQSIPEELADAALHPDHINIARIFELQRFMATVIVAQWSVISSSVELITNDDPIIPMFHVGYGQTGFGFPLTKTHYLGILPLTSYEILIKGRNREYVPNIHYPHGPITEQLHLNRSINANANRFVIGSSEDILRQYFNNNKYKMIIEPSEMGVLNSIQARNNEALWYHVASLIADPMRYFMNSQIDWEVIATDWHPGIVYFPTNVRPVGGDITLLHNSIFARLNMDNTIYSLDDFSG